jgi:hypothetical protein
MVRGLHDRRDGFLSDNNLKKGKKRNKFLLPYPIAHDMGQNSKFKISIFFRKLRLPEYILV